uniref:Uncharacterized protein n=1 Tax=Hemiselmis andersenii TaxID=464988 RepID=A0A6U4KJF0_HEMAN
MASTGGTLFVTGWGKHGQLGLKETTNAKVPTAVETPGDVSSVACGKKFTLFVCDGRVYAMGSNEHGELGTSAVGKEDRAEPVAVEGLDGVKIKDVAAGHMHGMALSEDGDVFSWGYGGDSMTVGAGALGVGDKKSRNVATHIKGLSKVTSISAGAQHAGAVTDDGVIWTWGLGEHGRLGHGDNHNLLEPKAIQDLPPTSFFTCGDNFCAAISKDNGDLSTWGYNKVGELGHEGMSVFAQENTPMAIDKEEFFHGERVVHIGCGQKHCVAVTEGGSLYVWGSAGFAHHTPYRVKMVSPPAWPSAKKIQKVFAGNSYSVALTAAHSVMTWGRNRWGMSGWEMIGTTGVLGLGDKTSGWGEVEPKEVEGLSSVFDVSTGPMHAAFLAR